MFGFNVCEIVDEELSLTTAIKQRKNTQLFQLFSFHVKKITIIY